MVWGVAFLSFTTGVTAVSPCQTLKGLHGLCDKIQTLNFHAGIKWLFLTLSFNPRDYSRGEYPHLDMATLTQYSM